MALYDTTALRLEAARNLGYTAGFMAATGRDFTGTITDYQQLSVDQQQALTREMFRVVAANPARFAPLQVAVATGGSFADFKNVPQPLTPTAAALVGAGEGLVDLPVNIGLAGAALVHSAGTIVRAVGTEAGGVVNATAGSILGVKISTVLWVAGGGVLLYFLATSTAGEKAAAYAVRRVVRRNPRRRRRSPA